MMTSIMIGFLLLLLTEAIPRVNSKETERFDKYQDVVRKKNGRN